MPYRFKQPPDVHPAIHCSKLAKEKFTVAALLELVAPEPGSSLLLTVPITPRRIRPSKYFGGLAMDNVTFTYPSRPAVPALFDVSLFLPASETTFIVGSSGSGKYTIAHLLQKMYEPQKGHIHFDDWDMRSLDENWFRSRVACVGQQGAGGVVILDEKSIFENISAAVHGHSSRLQSLKEVEEACRAALMHEFMRDLPQGYNTLIGGGAGVGLSGGQLQHLSIARARLWTPTVLILGMFLYLTFILKLDRRRTTDEATSALDSTS